MYGLFGMRGLMGSFGNFLPWIVGGAALVIIIVAAAGSGNKSPRLVLKEFFLNEREEEFLRIKGRAPGLLSWCLSLLGIDPITSLVCNKQMLTFEASAVKYGKKTLNIPLVAVTSVFSGMHKPFGLLVFGIVFILMGIVGAIVTRGGNMKAVMFFTGVVIGAICLYAYSVKKTIVFSIYNGGDKPIAEIQIGRSIIENQIIDELKYASAAAALNKAVLGIHYLLANAGIQNNINRQTE